GLQRHGDAARVLLSDPESQTLFRPCQRGCIITAVVGQAAEYVQGERLLRAEVRLAGQRKILQHRGASSGEIAAPPQQLPEIEEGEAERVTVTQFAAELDGLFEGRPRS